MKNQLILQALRVISKTCVIKSQTNYFNSCLRQPLHKQSQTKYANTEHTSTPP